MISGPRAHGCSVSRRICCEPSIGMGSDGRPSSIGCAATWWLQRRSRAGFCCHGGPNLKTDSGRRWRSCNLINARRSCFTSGASCHTQKSRARWKYRSGPCGRGSRVRARACDWNSNLRRLPAKGGAMLEELERVRAYRSEVPGPDAASVAAARAGADGGDPTERRVPAGASQRRARAAASCSAGGGSCWLASWRQPVSLWPALSASALLRRRQAHSLQR